jgi:hypothetical protein
VQAASAVATHGATGTIRGHDHVPGATRRRGRDSAGAEFRTAAGEAARARQAGVARYLAHLDEQAAKRPRLRDQQASPTPAQRMAALRQRLLDRIGAEGGGGGDAGNVGSGGGQQCFVGEPLTGAAAAAAADTAWHSGQPRPNVPEARHLSDA